MPTCCAHKTFGRASAGMVELIGPQMATFHYHSASPFFVAQFELSNHRLGGLFLLLTMAQFGGSSNLHAAIPRPPKPKGCNVEKKSAAARPARVTQFIFSSSADSLDLAAREHKRSCFRQGARSLA